MERFSMDGVVDELLCPICLDLFTLPIILPCSHVLCRTPCAERLFNQVGIVRCPVCRDSSYVSGGIDTLPRVISLEHIIEQYRNAPPPPEVAPADDEEEQEEEEEAEEEDEEGASGEPEVAAGACAMAEEDACGPEDIACQLCNEECPRRAIKSCLHCSASYCQRCLDFSHPAREPFIRHQLLDPQRYAKPQELRCQLHDVRVNIFCEDCQALGCLLCADDPKAHPQHQVLSLDQAAGKVKTVLEENLRSLTASMSHTQDLIRIGTERVESFQGHIRERNAQVQEQCEGLINEIEARRQFFLSDLEYEERSRSDNLQKQITEYRAQETNVQSLIHYTQGILKETDTCALIQLAKTLKERIKKALVSQGQISASPVSPTALNHKIVDFRKERATLKDMNYLTVPKAPVISFEKCSRSTHSVVLVLCAPEDELEVLDGYKVYYCPERETDRGHWETIFFETPMEERKSGRGSSACNGVCLVHDNLESATVYCFSVRAYNAAGESEMSPKVNCTTLSESHVSFPVPEIVENQCRTFSCSIQIHSPSPLGQDSLSASAEMIHYLLYREASANKIWKSILLFNRVDHRVFGLESDTMYDFVIMACNEQGECQVSNMVTLRTERTAF